MRHVSSGRVGPRGLGVAFLSGTLVLSDTLRSGFADVFVDANAGIDAVVRGDTALGADLSAQTRLVDSALVDDLADVRGAAVVTPEVRTGANSGPATGAPSAAADPQRWGRAGSTSPTCAATISWKGDRREPPARW